MRAADVASIVALGEQAGITWTQAHLLALLHSDCGLCLVQELGVGIVAALAAYVYATEAELLDIAVLPEMQRQQQGHLLLAEFVDQVRKRGCRSVVCEVARDNAAAWALYRKAGFVKVGERRGYYTHAGLSKDADVLRLALDGVGKDGAK